MAVDPDSAQVRASGGVVWRRADADLEVLVVHRPRYDDWSLPKGKLDVGESWEAAALREVEEETGLRCRLGSMAGAVTYADRHGRPKVVRYWTMTPEAGAFAPNEEVDQLRWMRLDAADAALSYPHDRDMLRSLVGARTQPPVFLVRHAKAGLRQRWTAPDGERPLTRRGRNQARRLVERFRGLEIARIVSSPLVRCVQTVEPLARERGLEVEPAPELVEGVDMSAALAFVRALEPVPVVVCGHGREIQELLRAFGAEGADLEGSGGIAKGSVWVLDRRDGAVVSARYLPPPGG
jgi:8-oxo-dGTP diphosphatase